MNKSMHTLPDEARYYWYSRMTKQIFWLKIALLVVVYQIFLVFFSGGSKLPSHPHIAKIVMDASIMSTSQVWYKALHAALTNKEALDGVLLEVNCPGGSLSVSELALEKVRRLAESVPVVTYVKGMAASGCYFVPMGAKHMVAHPDALVGSIGVVMTVPDATQALKALGVGVGAVPDTVSFLASSSALFHAQDKDLEYKRIVNHFNGIFIEEISKSRKELTPSSIASENIATGALFTADQALQKGLIDALGDQNDALLWIKKEKKRQYEVPLIDYATLAQ